MLNYATIAFALSVQPARTTCQPNQRIRPQRPFQPNNNRKCYNCNKSEHIARNYTAPKRAQRRIHFNTTWDVHYINFQDEQYDPEHYTEDENEEESEVYQYEQEAYSAMRSGSQYTPRQTT